jgi:hypothetical protein
VLSLLALLALPLDPEAALIPTEGVFDPVAARGLHMSPVTPRILTKKEEWLREKAARPRIHTRDSDLVKAPPVVTARKKKKARKTRKPTTPEAIVLGPGQRLEPVTTLYNIWTREALPILPGQSLEDRFHLFLRDHYTNQATKMDLRLADVLTRVAVKFSAYRIEVVSGYRSPKYNLMLRKKGRQVARNSQHMGGNAVDFRIRGVATKTLLHFVRSLRLGGVGFYPHSQFVHSDTGRIRYWKGS